MGFKLNMEIHDGGDHFWFFRMPFYRILRIGWRNGRPAFWIYNPHTVEQHEQEGEVTTAHENFL